MLDIARLRAAYETAKADLLAERTPGGWWVGELSSSALSTATAVSALAVVTKRKTPNTIQQTLSDLISRGTRWLARHQNDDGGFGDTDLSHSNIATTYLVVAALHLAGAADEHADLLARANAYIESKGGLKGLRERYGIDKTFVVPIMTNCAIAGLLDWNEIDPLPFELACVPQSLYRFVGMPVVSYAIPALVAIGQAVFHHAPPRNPVFRLVRWLSITRSLSVLRRMQPDSGGYLEATPLTSFVVMSLAAAQARSASEGSGPVVQSSTFKVHDSIANDVIREGVKFLSNSVRPDGSWPIDTNLATWNTTLAINALAGAGEDVTELVGPKCLNWLLSCQHTRRHPFTGADPGGFGWSDLSGAVPDADDTPGAILAMSEFMPQSEEQWAVLPEAATLAVRWLIALQNRDGGWPTFCRGWGKLPFDRSGVDLTAHAIRALADAYLSADINHDLDKVILRAMQRGYEFIERNQRSDGSWVPLWFGNQDHPHEENPIYGTVKALLAYPAARGLPQPINPKGYDAPAMLRGIEFLIQAQNCDGGWGSGVWGRVQVSDCRSQIGKDTPSENLKSSVEETALAVEALLAAFPSPRSPAPSPVQAAANKGLLWLIQRVESGQHRQPAPIGFYFAKLWYYEKLYPIIFTAAALGRAYRQFTQPAQPAAQTSPPTTRSL